MNEYQANVLISKLLKMLLKNSSLREKKEIHLGQSAWIDIWYGLYRGNIKESEGSSREFAGVTFLRDSTLQPDEIRLFCSGKCMKRLSNWQDIEC